MALLKEEGEKIRREREEKYDEKIKHLKEKRFTLVPDFPTAVL